MTISIDAATLTSYYNTKAGVPASASSTASTNTLSTAPRAPWSNQSSSSLSALAINFLAGQELINPSAAKLSAPSSSSAANSDYKNLFSLYQGLSTLSELASEAGSTSASAATLNQLNTAFQNGLSQVSSFLGNSPFQEFQLTQGSVATSASTALLSPSPNYTYQTQPIFTGTASEAVPSLSGNVTFNLTATLSSGRQVNVNFNLADLGGQTRSIENVVSYLNSKLKAAGLSTTFSDVLIPAVPQTVTEGGKTTTIAAGQNSYALKINGNGAESLSFSASGGSDGVYVLQGSGVTGTSTSITNSGTTATTSTTATQELIGLSTASTTGNKTFADTLSSATTSALASTAGPDGSIYVVSSAAGKDNGGASEAVLTKYDSAGNVVYTRTLGAQTAGTGYAVAVSADGKDVAVASGLASGSSATSSTSATAPAGTQVTEYAASNGQQNWTVNTGTSSGADHPTGISFGANDQVFVVGQTTAPFHGQTQTGSQDIYLQSIATSSVVTGVVATGTTKSGQASGFTNITQQSGVLSGLTQFGATGINSQASVAVSGNSVFVASVQNGDAVLQRFDTNTSGQLTLGLTRNLGDLKGGTVAGVSVDANGNVIVAGSTSNGALTGAAATSAYTGGEETFVATLSSTGAASTSDSVAFYDPGGGAITTGLSVVGTTAYVTGRIPGPITTASDGQRTSTGFVAGIDTTTGATTWTGSFKGTNGVDTPTSVTAVSGGASALNLLGLPEGTINTTQASTLVSNSDLTPGDQFSVKVGTGAASTITIAEGDTLATLAAKIQQASFGGLTATVTPTVGGKDLVLTPTNARTPVTLISGPAGRDALGPLKLNAGEVTALASSTATISSTSSVTKKPYSLSLSSNLNLGSANAIKQAQASLTNAQSVLKSIYLDMNTKPSTASSASKSSSGKVPAYLTAEISNYQSGLARLEGATSTSSTSSGVTLASLIS